ncbi:lycopene cyclase domain-containing protein [Candidatus Woesearchaeota archaeon]|nr:lycopene cyclase domain-containing protein [Candidatus Woesearchaeota archaeon]
MEYLIIEIILILITFLIHRHYKIKIFKSKKQMLFFWILVSIGGVIWDNYAVYRGHWLYPGKGTIGVNIGLIPLEDYIFMFLVGYGFLVLYTVSNKLTDEYRARKRK